MNKIGLSITFLISIFFINIVFSQEWFEKQAIGINYSFGKCTNKIIGSETFNDSIYYAFNKSDDSTTSNVNLKTGSNICKIEIYKAFYKKRFSLGIAYLWRKANTNECKSNIVTTAKSGSKLYKGCLGYEDKWVFIMTRISFNYLKNNNKGRLSSGLSFDLGFTPKSVLKYEGYISNIYPISFRPLSYGKITFPNRIGAIVGIDIKYDTPKIPLSLGIMGNIGAMGGTTVPSTWNRWNHTYNIYPTKDITITDKNVRLTRISNGILSWNYMFYISVYLPLKKRIIR